MSKLEELIEQYCPDGVEYKPLGDVCIFADGFPLKADNIKGQGIYPVVKIGNINNGVVDEQNCYLTSLPSKVKASQILSGGEILVGMSGSTGKTGYSVLQNAIVNQRIAIIRNNDLVLNGYLKHSLVNNNFESYCFQNGTGPQHNISKFDLLSYKIPVPPIPVQEEIVRILDTFTELQAELQAELQKRKQQYNYYLDNLLNFNDINRGGQAEVRWMKLSDTCLKICSGGTPSRKKAYYFKGGIPWLRTQEVDWNNIYDTEIKITAEAIKNSSARLIPENCVIIAMYGATAGKTGINKIPLTTNQACCNLQINPQIALYKYVYYWVCKNYEKIKSLGQGSQNNINAQIIKDYPIPIPSMAEQQRIVSILDRFDRLTNDLNAGLPAEIEKRRQQYEYYRDKILTFKRNGY